MLVYKNSYLIKNYILRAICDLQYYSITSILRKGKNIAKLDILDYGSGLTNYKRYFNYGKYHTLDPNFEADFKKLEDVKDKYDLILLIEVLEHIRDPKSLLNQLSSYLKKDGQIWISVPFAARCHPYPEDFYRFTEAGLRELCKDFTVLDFIVRGNNIATISTKINYLLYCCLKSWYFLMAILLAPFAFMLLIWSFFSLNEKHLDDDPLGFFLKIKK